MQYMVLEGSELRVSRLCLGTWQFNDAQPDVTWPAQDIQVSRGIVEAALELGVNFVDTAEAYGPSEGVLGRVLGLEGAGSGRRSALVLASKFGQNHPRRPGQLLYSALDIEASLTRSLHSLRTSYIDLYQVHWPVCLESYAETVAQLEREKARGRIRHYGLCNFGLENMREFAGAGGRPLTNQLPYNLLTRAIESEIVPGMGELGLGVLAYSPLQQGLLSGKFQTPKQVPEGRRRTRHFSSTSTALSKHGQLGAEEETFQAIEAVRGVLAGASMSEAALGWLLQQPRVASVIVGCSSVEQLRQNTLALRAPLAPDVVRRLNEATEHLRLTLGPNADLWAPHSRMK